MNLKITLTLILAIIGFSFGQTYDIVLLDGVVYKGCYFQRIVDSEVYIKITESDKVAHLPIESIVEIHPRRVPRSVVFGGLGFMTGVVLNAQAQSNSTRSIIGGPTALILMGFIVGAIPAGVGLLFDIAYWTSPRSKKIVLSQMTLGEKMSSIQVLISESKSWRRFL